MTELDWDKIDEVALALLSLTRDEHGRVWKGLSWDVTDRLFEKGWIDDPKSNAKSVYLTEEGIEAAERFLAQHFEKESPGN